jgi:photosystem II stability/assembly factor-like uncharacterized protein
MSATVLVGTQKGVVVLRCGADGRWSRSGLGLKGWLITAFARNAAGRAFAGVSHDIWGAAVMLSDDLEHWEQLEAAPRYAPSQKGNPGHNRVIGASDPMQRFSPAGRHVDQIWKLLAAGDRLYAGVSEAGLFSSDDAGKSWQVIRGIDAHPDRDQWVPGFGGLCLHSILVDARDPRRIWVGISSAGAFRSDDRGETFQSVNHGVMSGGEGYCVHSLAHDPQLAEVIYRQDHEGVYKTADAGDSWQRIENGLEVSTLASGHECSFGFASGMDPRSRSVFIVPIEGDSFRFPHGGRLRVHRSQDGGKSWQAFDEGLPRDCYANVLRGALAVDANDPCGVYFGTTAGSVYGSLDRGETWSQLAADLPKVLCVEAFVD